MKIVLAALVALAFLGLGDDARAQCSVPYTFVNNSQVADANQVNANFAAVANCAASGSTGTVIYAGPLDGVTPADTAMAAAIASVPAGGTLSFPPGQILLTASTQLVLNNINFQCAGAPNASNAPLTGTGKIGTYGTTFLLTSTTGTSVFGLEAALRIAGCNYYWPNQNGVATNPIVYPPLFSEVPGHIVENVLMDNDHVINAYHVWDQNTLSDTYGNIRIVNSDMYGIQSVLLWGNVQETAVVDNVVSNPSLFYDGAVSPPANLTNWTKLNGRWLHVFGNGGSVTGSTVQLGGLHTGQLTVVDYAVGVYVDPTGWLDESSFGPNTTFDSDEQVLLVGPNGGGISRVTFGGRYYAFDTQGGTSNGGAFVINNPAHVDGSEDVSITGTLAGGNGSFFTCIGTNMNVINIHDTQIQNYGESTTTGPYFGVYVNCPNAYVTINGNTMFPGVVGSNQGIAILAAHSAVIGNNSILSAFDAMSFPGFTGQAAVTGNIATNSQDTYSVPSTFGQNVAFGVNSFDKVNPALGQFKTPLPGSCAGLPSGTWWSNTLNVQVCP